jgi:flagellar hook-associated protein 2
MTSSGAYPLIQWMAKAQWSGMKAGLLRTALVGPTPAAGMSRAIAEERARVTALGQLSSAVSTFKTAVTALKSPSAVAPAQATSSNTAVAAATAQAAAAPATYTVNVAQLARPEVAISATVADPNLTLIGSGTLSVQLGRYNSGTNTFTAGASAPVSVTVTNGSLSSIASAINAAGPGITADVVQDPGGYHMILTSTVTGAASAFKITATDLDSVNTDMSGLSQLAYDPTAGAGAGKNLTETQSARDASLSVNGVIQTSASSAGISIATGVSLSLSQTGTTTITVSPNKTAIETAAKTLVAAYNTLIRAATSLSGRGKPLDGQTTRALLRSMSDTYQQRFPGAGSMTSLARMGMTPKADGTLSLDPTALQSAIAFNQPGTVAVLNDAAQTFESMATRYAAPGGEIAQESSAAERQLSYIEMMNGMAQSFDSLSQVQVSQSYQAALRLSAADQFTSLLKTLGYA